jgi:hypothetical protein
VNLPLDGDAEPRKVRIDVLSADEEDVLSDLRDIVTRARTAGHACDLGMLNTEVTTSGASVVGEGEDNGSIHFKRGDVHFLLRPVPGGCFEVSFPGPRS